MTPGELITDHHLFYPAKSYKTKLEKNFRSHRGLIVPTPYATQAALHRNMPNTPKPPREDMYNLLRVLEDTDEDDKRMPFWGLYKAIEYFEHQRRLEQHLLTQLGYVALNLGEMND